MQEQYHHTPGSAGTAPSTGAPTETTTTHDDDAATAPVPTVPGQRTLVGWREWVALPSVNLPWIKAKVDTGAKTSSLHAFDLRPLDREGQDWVRFTVHPLQSGPEDAVVLELPVHDRRTVRSSSGHAEDRVVVQLPLVLAGREVLAEVTLTDRDEMGFRMLIGREALAQGYLVDPAASYLGGRPDREVRRRNWGTR